MSVGSNAEQDHIEAWRIAEHADKLALVGPRSGVEIGSSAGIRCARA